jgi:hypothetical protein
MLKMTCGVGRRPPRNSRMSERIRPEPTALLLDDNEHTLSSNKT